MCTSKATIPRRSVGISALRNRTTLSKSFATMGDSLRSQELNALRTQLSVAQAQCYQFALKHAEAIKLSPEVRSKFTSVCDALGVDPMAAIIAKGDGDKSLEEIAQFYNVLAVRIVQYCKATRDENGGLISVEDCREKVRKGRGIGGEMKITNDDILRAVERLKPLGSGFSIVTVGQKQMIRSVPKELSTDQSKVLEIINIMGYGPVSCTMLEDNLTWERARVETVLQDLMSDSLIWVDPQTEGEPEYWSPAYMYQADHDVESEMVGGLQRMEIGGVGEALKE